MSNFDAEWFNCFLCDRVFSLSLSLVFRAIYMHSACPFDTLDRYLMCFGEPRSINFEIAGTNMQWWGKKGEEKKERKRKGRKGKKKKEEEKKKQKRNVVELCKECAIGNEDDDDNDEQG